MTNFLSNNFSEPRWKQAALKNAFALSGKQRLIFYLFLDLYFPSYFILISRNKIILNMYNIDMNTQPLFSYLQAH